MLNPKPYVLCTQGWILQKLWHGFKHSLDASGGDDMRIHRVMWGRHNRDLVGAGSRLALSVSYVLHCEGRLHDVSRISHFKFYVYWLHCVNPHHTDKDVSPGA